MPDEARPILLPGPSLDVAVDPCPDTPFRHDPWRLALTPFRDRGPPILVLLRTPAPDRRARARELGAATVLRNDTAMHDRRPARVGRSPRVVAARRGPR